MALRNGHGKGAGVPRIEVLPVDELPAASPLHAVRADRDASGRFLPGNAAGRERKLRPGLRGLVGIERSATEFRPFARWGSRYGAHRRRELAAAHGGSISAGVGAIVESAALAMAASRYLDHLGRQHAEPEAAADLFKQAAQLGQTARQHELAAWELAAREATARRAAQPDTPHARLVEAFGSPAASPSSGTTPRGASTPGEAPEAPSRGGNGQSAVHGSKGLSMPEGEERDR